MAEIIDKLRSGLADRYRIIREVGHGGMAAVFLGEDLKHSRRVAIKVMDPELATLLGPDRFQREIQISARLQHPNVLPLLDSGSADGLLFYVMPYVEGESLRQRLDREGQLPVAEALRLASEAADALEYAHGRGTVHRDIKPENILLSSGHAIVADFGVARAVHAAGGTRLTEQGVVVGTPRYMSPEQALGGTELDARSDLYSLGCVVYEMLAGQPPFMGPTRESLLHQHTSVTPRPLVELRPTVPENAAAAVSTALAKVPADRFRSVGEFARSLAGASAPVSAASARTSPAARGSRPRRPGILVGALGVAALVAAGMLWRLWLFDSRPGVRPLPSQAGKVWVIMPEFERPGADTGVGDVVRELLRVRINQSGRFAVVSDDQVDQALTSAGKSGDSRITPKVAVELAGRSRIQIILSGHVQRVGDGYAIVLRATHARPDTQLAAVDGQARNEDEVIATVEDLGNRMLRALGERNPGLRATRSLRHVMTPSFEALKELDLGDELARAGDPRGAIPYYRRALAIDPDFASAWMALGAAYANLFQGDAERIAYEEALRRPQRLDAVQQELCRVSLAGLRRDHHAVIEACNRIIALDSTSSAFEMRAMSLAILGNTEEALRDEQVAAALSPFGTEQGHIWNMVIRNLTLGRIEDARKVSRGATGPFVRIYALWIALAEESWDEVERLAVEVAENPSAELDASSQHSMAFNAWRARAVAAAARGSLVKAEQLLKEGEEKPRHLEATAARLALALGRDRVPGPLGSETSADTTHWGLCLRAMWAAARGDTIQAGDLLARLKARPIWDPWWSDDWPSVAEALIAESRGKPEKGVEAIRSTLRAESSTITYLVMARLFERLDRPDSAITYLEASRSAGWTVGEHVFIRGMLSPLIRLRLVGLNLRIGRVAAARRYWQEVKQACDRPDSDLSVLLDDLGTGLSRAEMMARPSDP